MSENKKEMAGAAAMAAEETVDAAQAMAQAAEEQLNNAISL